MHRRHLRLLVLTLVGVGLIAPSADAALKKYRVNFNQTVSGLNVSPNPDFNVNLGEPESLAVIDESGGSPVLKRLFIVSDTSITTLVPGVGGWIYTSGYEERGPTGEFTGTGSTDTTIAWGIVTGWTVSGTHWCHSSPTLVCGLADRVDLESIDPLLQSPFYDLGTWTFHGTGWMGRPWVHRTQETAGNEQYILRGALVLDGTVPALPVMGLAILGGSLVLGSLAALRRGRK